MKIDQKARLVEAINGWIEQECETDGIGPWIHGGLAGHIADCAEAIIDAMDESQKAKES